jgi:hypothetical protein
MRFRDSIIGNKLTQEQQGAKLRLVCDVAERVRATCRAVPTTAT